MNHHAPGVIVFPGATGTVDFLGVNPGSYIVVFAGQGLEGVQVWWTWPTSDTLRIHAHNMGKKPATVIPMIKDDR